MKKYKKQRRKRKKKRLGRKLQNQLLKAQQNEITEYEVYKRLAQFTKDTEHQEIFTHIAQDEKNHADFWQKYTNQQIRPQRWKVWFHIILARLLGFTFSAKLMEKGEEQAQINYKEIAKDIPEAEAIEKEETEHEKQLLHILDEESLQYVGSMVLGVNDALVELTGALAGFTLALQNTSLIAVIGLITGIAAALSMGASEYLSIKAEFNEKSPFKASLYTGSMYLITVIFLVLPYFFFNHLYTALAVTLATAVAIIFAFTFYISVAQNRPFKKRFAEMAVISLGVSVFTFILGYVVRSVFDIKV